MTALALKAMKEAVADVYAEHSRRDLPVAVWDEKKGKVVWIVPTREGKSSKKRFDTGLEFVGLKPEQLVRLRSYIEKSVQNSAV